MTSFDAILAEHSVSPADIMTSLGVSKFALYKWRTGACRPHPAHAVEIEEKFGIPRHKLRPDLWDPDYCGSASGPGGIFRRLDDLNPGAVAAWVAAHGCTAKRCPIIKRFGSTRKSTKR
jgi:DNA-binding transcriptional regulator YdaS (Cro superfamily)